MKKSFPTMFAKRGGWCDWVMPIPKGYLMKCCDCGLVHEMQFKPFVEKDRKRNTFKIVALPYPFRVMFRARRDRSGGA